MVNGKIAAITVFIFLNIIIESGMLSVPFKRSLFPSFFKKREFINCRFTHNGIEYGGNIKRAITGRNCISWKSIKNESFTDDDFVDKSIKDAKNYCRNPRGKLKEVPWCYTERDFVIRLEMCNIPLCNYDCKITAAGIEYGGDMQVSQNSESCANWTDAVPILNETVLNHYKKEMRDDYEPFIKNIYFPKNDTRHRACRNPTGNSNGPFCFVHDIFSPELRDKYDQEACDIEFCNTTTGCMLGTNTIVENRGFYTHFIRIQNHTQFKIDIKLWNIEDYFRNVSFRIALSLFPLPFDGLLMQKLNYGFELFINQTHVGFQKENTVQYEKFKSRPISGIKNFQVILNWWKDAYSLHLSLPSADLKKNVIEIPLDSKGIMERMGGMYEYASIIGDSAIWEITYPNICEKTCVEHLTLSRNYTIYLLMSKNMHKNKHSGYTISFHLRTHSHIYITLRLNPATRYPNYEIEIGRHQNKNPINFAAVYYEEADDIRERLEYKEFDYVEFRNILSYRKWIKFRIFVNSNTLKLIYNEESNFQTIFDIVHGSLKGVRWFSFGSVSIAHWVFNCTQIEQPKSFLPECISRDLPYKGKAWVTTMGKPCLPWSFPELTADTAKMSDDDRLDLVNYCKQSNQSMYPYCYYADETAFPQVKKIQAMCDIPVCSESDCITAYGDDYEGTVNTSRSGRKCILWKNVETNLISPQNFNLTKPELKNYCRNIRSQHFDWNIFGPFCVVEANKKMIIDHCNLPDCNEHINSESTITFENFHAATRRFYVTPEWYRKKFYFNFKNFGKRSKEYSNDELKIELTVNESPEQTIVLSIYTIDTNTTFKLTFASSKDFVAEKIITEEIIGKFWQSFWLLFNENEIQLGLKTRMKSILYWKLKDDIKKEIKSLHVKKIIFLPTMKNAAINFPISYCLIQEVWTKDENFFYPINYLSTEKLFNNSLVIHLYRHDYNNKIDSYTSIKLYGATIKKFIEIRIQNTTVKLIFSESRNVTISNLGDNVLSRIWRSFTIDFNETYIHVKDQFYSILEWKSVSYEPLQIYYFTVITDQEKVTWIANNCPKINMNVEPINGKWSEWSEVICSVPCGKGIGYKKRLCNNPSPNIYGKPCTGEDTLEVECNQDKCDCIKNGTFNDVFENSFNEVISEDTSIVLICPFNILKEVYLSSPRSDVQWLKDGFVLNDTRVGLDEWDGKSIKNYTYEIKNSKIDDTGIYSCTVIPHCESDKVIYSEMFPVKIIVVAVEPKNPVKIRKKKFLQLTCHNVFLQFFYTELNQEWELNNDTYIDFSKHEMNDFNFYTLFDVDDYHKGIWKCIITHETKHHLKWITNIIKVHVLEAPTILSYIKEEDATNVIFHDWEEYNISNSLLGFVFFEILAMIYLVYWYWKTRKEILNEQKQTTKSRIKRKEDHNEQDEISSYSE